MDKQFLVIASRLVAGGVQGGLFGWMLTKSQLTRKQAATLFVIFMGAVIVLGTTACTSVPMKPPVVEKPAPDPAPVTEPAPQPIYTVKADWPNKKWTAITLSALQMYGVDLLNSSPSDIKDWCGSWGTVDRFQFWTMFISSLARFESDFDPSTTYGEAFNDAKGSPVISRGVMQVSQESANGQYYQCGIKNAQDLHDVKTNLVCAVKIMNYWIKTDKVMTRKDGATWKGIARYWGPMRKAEKIAKIQLKTKSVCQ